MRLRARQWLWKKSIPPRRGPDRRGEVRKARRAICFCRYVFELAVHHFTSSRWIDVAVKGCCRRRQFCGRFRCHVGGGEGSEDPNASCTRVSNESSPVSVSTDSPSAPLSRPEPNVSTGEPSNLYRETAAVSDA